MLDKSFMNHNGKLENRVTLGNHYYWMAPLSLDAETLSRVINKFHRFKSNWITKNVDCVDYAATRFQDEHDYIISG